MHAKSIEKSRGKTFDYVVTVCDHAKEACPFFLVDKVLHRNFTNSSTFKGGEDKILEEVRQIRDEIKKGIKRTFAR